MTNKISGVLFVAILPHDKKFFRLFGAILPYEKRADHSLRDEQGRFRPRSFLCAVAPRFSVDISLPTNSANGTNIV